MVEATTPHNAGVPVDPSKTDEGAASGAGSKPHAPKVTAATPAPVTTDEQGHKVVRIVRQLSENAGEPVVKKRSWTLISAFIVIVLPTLLAAIFYLFIAADRYTAEVAFSVRGASGDADHPDSYLIADFIDSPEIVRQLMQRLPLRTIYSTRKADYFSRLSGDAPFEALSSYWHHHVDAYYDSAKSTISIEVQAFTPDDALNVATETLNIIENLVNNLGLQARQDALSTASADADAAADRSRQTRQDLLDFEQAHGGVAGATAGTAAVAGVTTADIAAFQVMQAKQTFADKAYADALSRLEQARADAGRTTAYLAVFAQPQKPEQATYPRRIFNVLVVFLLSAVVWAVGALGALTIRDHIP